MRVNELKKLLKGQEDCELFFFNRDENEGSQFYQINSVEFRKNDRGGMRCVLTDDVEGVVYK